MAPEKKSRLLPNTGKISCILIYTCTSSVTYYQGQVRIWLQVSGASSWSIASLDVNLSTLSKAQDSKTQRVLISNSQPDDASKIECWADNPFDRWTSSDSLQNEHVSAGLFTSSFLNTKPKMTSGCEVTCRVEAQAPRLRVQQLETLRETSLCSATHYESLTIKSRHCDRITQLQSWITTLCASKMAFIPPWSLSGFLWRRLHSSDCTRESWIESFHADIIKSLYDLFKVCIMFVEFW